MYRKIMGFLEAWKENEHRKPLILQGARQVGKTYSILEFGRIHYENVAYFNFETNPKLNETFEEKISPDYLIPILSHIAGQTIVKEKTLIVFDEVQLCERALTSLKYFCEDAPDYHIVALGSLLGVAVGNIFAGIPMDAAGDYAGVPLIGLITPFTLLTGLLGLVMFLAAGACWAALKAPLPSYLQARAARLRLPLQVIALVLFAVVSVYALVLVGPEMDPNLGILRWLFAALVVVGLLASLVVGKTSGDDLKAFLAQSASMIALVALLACSMFPVLVNATADSVGPAITLANAASSELSLTWMTIILCIGLPLVLVYHVVIYRTFRGRVNPADLEEY